MTTDVIANWVRYNTTMKLIVGLGNPGKKYEETRHNAGFMGVDYLAKHFGFEKFKKADKHKSEISEGKIGSEKVLLIKPQTFMNLSGQAVRSVARFYKIPMGDLIIIFDDVDLPSGKLRIRPSGSAGGHKGMKSVIQELGTNDFVRIRFGMAPPSSFKGDLEDYVLGKLTFSQKKFLTGNIKELPQILEVLLKEGVEQAMQEYN